MSADGILEAGPAVETAGKMSLGDERTHEGLSDRSLVESLKAGNHQAFEVLYYRYRVPVYNLAYRMLGDQGEAQDMTQEAFIKILRGIKSFDLDRNFFSWLYKIATNVCLDYIRKRRRQPLTAAGEMTIEGDMESGEALHQEPIDLVDRQAVQESVGKALAKLPEHYRLILILRELQGFKYAEIAEIMDVSIYSVQTTLFRARKMFKKEYLKIEAEDAEE